VVKYRESREHPFVLPKVILWEFHVIDSIPFYAIADRRGKVARNLLVVNLFIPVGEMEEHS